MNEMAMNQLQKKEYAKMVGKALVTQDLEDSQRYSAD